MFLNLGRIQVFKQNIEFQVTTALNRSNYLIPSRCPHRVLSYHLFIVLWENAARRSFIYYTDRRNVVLGSKDKLLIVAKLFKKKRIRNTDKKYESDKQTIRKIDRQEKRKKVRNKTQQYFLKPRRQILCKVCMYKKKFLYCWLLGQNK